MKNISFDSITTIDSPIGKITLKSIGEAVVQVNLHGFNQTQETEKQLQTSQDKSEPSPVLREATSQLRDYFAGKRKDLTFAVNPAGTEFQRAVWFEIAKIRFGEVASYADLAKRIGNPAAVRAVGGAVGSNPVALVIGCHRVLGSGSTITGYSGGDGLPTKRWLLAHESIEYKDVAAVRKESETPIQL